MSVPFRIVISASFTAEPVAASLLFWGEQMGMVFDVAFAPFQQVAQTLLNPAGEFAANAHGANIAMVRAGDFGERARDLIPALKAAAARDKCPLLLVICPEVNAAEVDAIRDIEEELLAALPGHTLDYRRVESLYPVAEKFDEAANRLGSIPYTEEYFTVLGTGLARQIAALSLLPYKAIAVDCDNTLWAGVCGEDGAAGVRLDAGRLALQQFLLRQRDAGMLLCLASKNNPADVFETFAQHPEMPLQPDHFTAMRLNWEPKPGNLFSLAEELTLGPDSFIFLDDSPKECEEMREARPEVLTLELPADSTSFSHFLEHVWAFDHPVITAADKGRAASYAQAQEFGSAVRGANSLENFMASLDLKVEIAPLNDASLARAAQLTQRTNQFNFTTIRRTEAGLRSLLPSHTCLTVSVADRFGDYGLTGLVIFSALDDAIQLDTFLLSCRVLGRGVEHAVMAHLGELAETEVKVEIRPTAKNQPAMQFLHSVGSEYREGGMFRFPAAYLRSLQWKAIAQATQPAAPMHESFPHRSLSFAKIANELSTVSQIMSAMRAGRTAFTGAGLSGTEQELASLWADLLLVSDLAPDDRFFERGGHSLLAVLLISRVRERFGVELPIDDVYSGDMTLRTLAAKIDAMREGGIDSAEYEAMMAEIAQLSDDEVKALLGQQ